MFLYTLIFCLAFLVGGLRAHDVYDAALQEREWTVGMRRKLHQYPELGFEEMKTSAMIQGTLLQLNIPFESVAKTGVVASIGNGSPVIALRADMDALPIQEPEGLDYRSKHEGRMHACGHDSHMAMLLAAGKLLKAREDSLNGTVKLLFQPGEEGYAGAKHMIDEGALEGVEAVYGFHNMPTMPTGTVGGRAGTIMAGCAQFHVYMHGRGGHAAMPHGNIDPVVAAAQLVTALQTLASRETSPLDSTVVSVTILKAGDAYNVIPDTTEVAGTLRGLKLDTFERMIKRIDEMAIAIGRAFGCNATIKWDMQPTYPPTVNDAQAWTFARSAAARLFGEDKVMEVEPIMPGEDLSFMLQKVPGAMIFLGHQNSKVGSGAALHSPNFKLDEDMLPRGAALHVELALAFLNGKDRLDNYVETPSSRDEL